MGLGLKVEKVEERENVILDGVRNQTRIKGEESVMVCHQLY